MDDVRLGSEFECLFSGRDGDLKNAGLQTGRKRQDGDGYE